MFVSKVRLAISVNRASLEAMLGWSINLFRIRGIRLSLHFSFLLMLAYVCQEGWQEAGMTGLWWSAGTFLAFFTCVVLHELGHSFTAMRFGVHVRRILLMPIGGMAEFDQIPRRPSQEFLITIAGPAVNFAIAAILWCVIDLPGGWSAEAATNSFVDLGRTLLVWNLWMGLFNLLPAFPMDGGRILRSILAMRMPYLRATYWAVNTAKVVMIPAIILALYKGWYLTVAIFVFIYLAGEAEYRAVKRRDADEAQWKEALMRQMAAPPADDPPVLNG
jgi:Zn-dependent protease